MFDKILIANRGEIACRVIDTCRGWAWRPWPSIPTRTGRRGTWRWPTRRCISAVRNRPTATCGVTAIIEAAKATGAQAIHPGYGFLSENPDFVEAVEAAGLVFIGPSAAAIRAMGLKDAAKALMAEAGVPVVPGYHGQNQEAEHLSGAADAIGYPVLIKAVAGGGGKGMRKVAAPADFMDALASARGRRRRPSATTRFL
jgi:3-methylcrotonyl-CoA carboxylase alpha subunit